MHPVHSCCLGRGPSGWRINIQLTPCEWFSFHLWNFAERIGFHKKFHSQNLMGWGAVSIIYNYEEGKRWAPVEWTGQWQTTQFSSIGTDDISDVHCVWCASARSFHQWIGSDIFPRIQLGPKWWRKDLNGCTSRSLVSSWYLFFKKDEWWYRPMMKT